MRMYNQIQVTFKSRDYKMKIVKEIKKFFNADLTDISAERVYLNENLSC